MTDVNELIKMKIVCIGGRETSAIKGIALKGLEALDIIDIDSSVQSNRESIIDSLSDTDLIFIVTAMDSATDTSVAGLVAECSRDIGALTIGVVVESHAFNLLEWKNHSGIEKLTRLVDITMVITKEQLCSLVKSIYGLITKPELINIDFSNIRSVLRDSGYALMGSATVCGENLIAIALQTVLDSQPLQASFHKARRVLISITSAEKNLEITEVLSATSNVQEMLHQDANMIFGTSFDETMSESVRVTVIATDFDYKK